MPIRIVEIDAAATIEMVDLTGPLAAEIRVVLDTGGADAGKRGVEFSVADQESVVLRAEALGVGKIEGDAVWGFDRHEVGPLRSCFEVQDTGEKFGRSPFVLRRDDRVVELDTHFCPPVQSILPRLLGLLRHLAGAPRQIVCGRSTTYAATGRTSGSLDDLVGGRD